MIIQISRRTLAKALAATGTAAGFSHLLGAEAADLINAPGVAQWKNVHPGVWRARSGTPEHFTPVSSRMVEPDSAAPAKKRFASHGEMAQEAPKAPRANTESTLGDGLVECCQQERLLWLKNQ